MNAEQAYTDNAVVLICMGDLNQNANLLELAVQSLRLKSGFEDDIIVFTDFDRKFTREDELNIRRVVVNETVNNDPKNFRLFMDNFYDFSQHKKIIYMDFDILVLKNISKAFNFIKDNAVYFTYAPVFPWHDLPFGTAGYIMDYQESNIVKGSPTGICSGIFGIQTKALSNLLEKWRQILKVTRTNNDQHALNEAIVKEVVKGVAYPNEWISYPFQVRVDAHDRRLFDGQRDYIFYHFNPANNQVKLNMMTQYMNSVS